jgi:phospholipase/carboxylesterase
LDAQAFQGNSLSYVLVKPQGYEPAAGYPLVVLLHGFGASMYDLAGLAPAIDAGGYVYAFPNAPFSLPLGPGMTGYSWMAGRPGVQEPAPGGPSTEEMLEAFLEEVAGQTGVADGQIVLGGFSQGGGMTLRYGLPRPKIFAGLSVLSGFFRDFDELRSRLPQKRTQPVFLVHGRQDQMIPLDRARETRSFLEEAGYTPEYHEYDMAHEVTPDVIRDLVPWLHAVLPPRAD